MSNKIDHWWPVFSGLLSGIYCLNVAAKAVPYVFAMAFVVLMLAFIPQLSLRTLK